jgi:dTDP-4-amino-4,6-dideoxygalactose transaminase
MTTLTWDRHRGHASSYDVVEIGFNFRLDEIRAAMASVQLGRIAATTRRRAELADRYLERLDGRHELVVPFADRSDRADAAHHLAVVVLPDRADRDAVRSAMASEGIQTSVHYPPTHSFTAYRDLDVRQLPRTEEIAARIVTLPLHPGMTDDDVDLVTDSLCRAVDDGRRSDASDGHGSPVRRRPVASPDR